MQVLEKNNDVFYFKKHREQKLILVEHLTKFIFLGRCFRILSG